MKKTQIPHIALSILFIGILSACGTVSTPRINNYLKEVTPINLSGRDISVTYNETMKTEIASLGASILEHIRKEDISFSSFSNDYMAFCKYNKTLRENIAYIDIKKCQTGDQSLFDLSIDASACLSDYLATYKQIIVAVASSGWRSTFFYGMSDEEIEEIVASYSKSEPDDIRALRREMSELQNRYHNKQITFVNFMSTYAQKANQVASFYGYDSYIDYSYKNVYGREYTTNEVDTLVSMTKEYVVPVATDFQDKKNNATSSMDDRQNSEYALLANGFMGPSKKYFDSYANYIGGDFSASYDYLWRSGNYFFSNSGMEDTTAYVTSYWGQSETFMVFSKNYQNIRTFSHEFGHYADSHGRGGTSSYDLCEVHSQADELLFGAYLEQNHLLDETITRAFLYSAAANIVSSIQYCGLVGAMEIYMYQNPSFDEATLTGKYNEVAEEMGFATTEDISDTYLAKTAPFSPGYYISYATSAFSALSVFGTYLNKGLDEAKTQYLKALYYPGDCETYSDVIEYADLYNPFESQDFIAFHNDFIND